MCMNVFRVTDHPSVMMPRMALPRHLTAHDEPQGCTRPVVTYAKLNDTTIATMLTPSTHLKLYSYFGWRMGFTSPES
jgi:hypothetical protein